MVLISYKLLGSSTYERKKECGGVNKTCYSSTRLVRNSRSSVRLPSGSIYQVLVCAICRICTQGSPGSLDLGIPTTRLLDAIGAQRISSVAYASWEFSRGCLSYGNYLEIVQLTGEKNADVSKKRSIYTQ